VDVRRGESTDERLSNGWCYIWLTLGQVGLTYEIKCIMRTEMGHDVMWGKTALSHGQVVHRFPHFIEKEAFNGVKRVWRNHMTWSHDYVFTQITATDIIILRCNATQQPLDDPKHYLTGREVKHYLTWCFLVTGRRKGFSRRRYMLRQGCYRALHSTPNRVCSIT